MSALWVIKCFTFSVGGCIMIGLLTKHFYNTFKDETIKYNQITNKSTLLSILTILALLFFTLTIINGIVYLWSYFATYCTVGYVLYFATYFICGLILLRGHLYGAGKWTMYYIFLLRLHVIYECTEYAYNKNKLLSVALLLTINNSAGYILNILSFKPSDPTLFADIEGAMICGGAYNPYCLAWYGLTDIVLCVGFLVAFIVPLKKLMNGVENASYDLMETAHKATIITLSVTGSTIIFLFGLVLSPKGMLAFFYSVELIINMIGLMMMTKYYKNNKYFVYERLCGGVIGCGRLCGAARTRKDRTECIVDADINGSTSNKTEIIHTLDSNKNNSIIATRSKLQVDSDSVK